MLPTWHLLILVCTIMHNKSNKMAPYMTLYVQCNCIASLGSINITLIYCAPQVQQLNSSNLILHTTKQGQILDNLSCVQRPHVVHTFNTYTHFQFLHNNLAHDESHTHVKK